MQSIFSFERDYMQYCAMGTRNTAVTINERRQKVWTFLTRGMKRHEIAKELNTDRSTVSRDIKFLAGQSQNYLNELAKQTLPFMYQMSIEGIRDVIKECYTIYESEDSSRVNMYHKLAALKLAKECHEAVFKLVDEGPSVMLVKQLQEKVLLIENRQTA
jgi:IS30 family transposase